MASDHAVTPLGTGSPLEDEGREIVPIVSIVFAPARCPDLDEPDHDEYSCFDCLVVGRPRPSGPSWPAS